MYKIIFSKITRIRDNNFKSFKQKVQKEFVISKTFPK